MDLMQSINVSASGMQAQSLRMKLAAENIANADSAASEEGGAYRRKMVSFKAELDRQSGLTKVVPTNIERDYKTPLRTEYDPAHPLADAQGFVQMPNVNTMVEGVDMREATRLYEANMAAIESAKQMMARSIEALR